MYPNFFNEKAEYISYSSYKFEIFSSIDYFSIQYLFFFFLSRKGFHATVFFKKFVFKFEKSIKSVVSKCPMKWNLSVISQIMVLNTCLAAALRKTRTSWSSAGLEKVPTYTGRTIWGDHFRREKNIRWFMVWLKILIWEQALLFNSGDCSFPYYDANIRLLITCFVTPWIRGCVRPNACWKATLQTVSVSYTTRTLT